MLTSRKFVFIAAVALGAAAGDAQAQHGGHAPFSNNPRYPTLGTYLFQSHNQPKPTFQAAPWYLYWPYDGHFLTPAPVNAPFYAPPGNGNFPVNPYFPAPNNGYYGPMPGGPAPAGYPSPPAGYPSAPAGYGPGIR